jgi:hypothetical protein
MTVMDDDKDILAGRYLNEDEQIAAGTSFIIDIFELCIVHQIMQVKDVCADPVNLVDLTSECPVANPDRRIGGRFWVLADGVEDDDEEDVSAAADELKNFQDEEGDPSAMAEELQLVPTRATEIQKQDVFSREGNRRHERPAKRQVKPWIGPIPKVCVKPVTLSDFLPDDWTFVTRRKKKKRRAAGLPPAMVIGDGVELRAARRARLNFLLGQRDMGVHEAGFVAQIEAHMARDRDGFGQYSRTS